MAKVIHSKNGTTVVLPTEEEDAAINVAAAEDPDNPERTEVDFARMRPFWDYPELVDILQKADKLGRPPLPEGEKKQRVTLYLDREVVDRLKADGKDWQTRANARLRAALGLAASIKGTLGKTGESTE